MAYDARNREGILRHFLYKIGIGSYFASHGSMTKETWMPFSTRYFLFVTLRPVAHPTAPGHWNSVSFFTAEIEPFNQNQTPQRIRDRCFQALESLYPAVTICYSIIPETHAHCRFGVGERFHKTFIFPRLVENDPYLLRLGALEVQSLATILAFLEEHDANQIERPDGL